MNSLEGVLKKKSIVWIILQLGAKPFIGEALLLSQTEIHILISREHPVYFIVVVSNFS